MNSIMMVDGYDLPFDGHKKKAKKAKKRKSRKAKGHKSASWFCAGAKHRKACVKKISSLGKRARRKCAKK